MSSRYDLEPSRQRRNPWVYMFAIVGVVVLLAIVTVAILAYTSTGSSTTVAPAPTIAEVGSPAWISGVDDCPESIEYGTKVAPSAGFYPTTEVDPLNRLGVIPHGAQVERLSALQRTDWVRIRYTGQVGYVQGILVIDYDPATGVRPDRQTCG